MASEEAVNPEQRGTKACAWYQFESRAGTNRRSSACA